MDGKTGWRNHRICLWRAFGAIFGAAFGHAFDTGTEIDAAGSRQRLSTVEHHQLTFFVAAFSMLAKLAQADAG